MTRERAAVIGAGVAGLTAAYLLQRRYDVTLFEADDRLGGHAHTHDVVADDHGLLAVDSGFIVHNQRTYPHLLRLFAELGVQTKPTEMSMSVSCAGCGLQYAGARGIYGLFAQPASVANRSFLRMLVEVKRFHRLAARTLDAEDDSVTLQDFVKAGGFSSYFVHHFLVPVVSAVWSASTEDALGYPARYLFRFLDHHGMLRVTGSPTWRTVVGGSRVYVERAAKNLSAVQLGTPVRGIARHDHGIDVRDDDDQLVTFDRVVVATHADTALRLLEDPSADERRALGAFRYSRNETVLHTDAGVLPSARRAQASWNYRLPGCTTATDRVLVTYDMNRLQQLPSTTKHLVTLNAGEAIDPERVIATMAYEHPVFTRESVAVQPLMPGLNTGRIAFAGAYQGWGFHEDGCRSGAAAAGALGVAW